MRRLFSLVNGHQDIGHSPAFWVVFVLGVGGFLAYPLVASSFAAYNVAYYLLNVPMALGLCLLWGYCGVLSFGQVAFFGVAGYAYGIIAGNMLGSAGGPLLASLAGLAAAAMLAAVFGYFIFFGRVRNWIIPILTLVLTLLLETFLGQTAGYEWRIGTVMLGGYNGMTGIPNLQVAGFIFDGYAFYYLTVAIVLACYLGLRMVANSHAGEVVVAVREDALRTELLGYDIRLWQWGIFVLSAVLAGLSGVLYVQWGNYIQPSALGLLQAALPVIWVAVGGRQSLLAVMLATFALNWLNYTLSSAGNQYALVIIGGLLVAVMMFAPRGIVVVVADILKHRPGGERRGWRALIRNIQGEGGGTR